MSLAIANAIGEVKDVTGREAHAVGATIFVRGALPPREREELRDRLDNPEILTEESSLGQKTKIRL